MVERMGTFTVGWACRCKYLQRHANRFINTDSGYGQGGIRFILAVGMALQIFTKFPGFTGLCSCPLQIYPAMPTACINLIPPCQQALKI